MPSKKAKVALVRALEDFARIDDHDQELRDRDLVLVALIEARDHVKERDDVSGRSILTLPEIAAILFAVTGRKIDPSTIPTRTRQAKKRLARGPHSSGTLIAQASTAMQMNGA